MPWFWQQQQEHRGEEPGSGQFCGMRGRVYTHTRFLGNKRGFPTTLESDCGAILHPCFSAGDSPLWRNSPKLSVLGCRREAVAAWLCRAGLAGRSWGQCPVGQLIQFPHAWKHLVFLKCRPNYWGIISMLFPAFTGKCNFVLKCDINYLVNIKIKDTVNVFIDKILVF